MKHTKYYGVQIGRNPGVYTSWEECKDQINRFSGARFKSFGTEPEAISFVAAASAAKTEREPEVAIYTDGSFDPSEGAGGYAAIFVRFDKQIGHVSGKCTKDPRYRNISAEIEAVEQALTVACLRGYNSVEIHHDYTGISEWVEGSWAAKNGLTKAYVSFMETIREMLDVRFVKVKGHSGVFFNEQADFLANTSLYFEGIDICFAEDGKKEGRGFNYEDYLEPMVPPYELSRV